MKKSNVSVRGNTRCKPNNTEQALCRVCFENKRVMVNISECTTGSSISIADMLSKFTGRKVSPGDSYPQSICLNCLEDVPSAFRIKQTFEKSYSLYCHREEKVLGTNEEDDEIYIVSESPTPDEESYTNECKGPVKNELIEEDDFEEQEYQDFEPLCEIKTEEQRLSMSNVSNAEKNSKDASSTTPIKCSRCQSTFPELQQLLKHMEDSHMNSARSGIRFCFQVGLRQGSRLIHTLDDNQLYRKNVKLSNGDATYVCRIKTCNARVYLTKDEKQVYAKKDQVYHSHTGQGLEIQKMVEMDQVKNKCMNERANLKKIFNGVMDEQTQDEDESEIDIPYDILKRTMQRKKQPLRRLTPRKSKT